MNFQERPSFGKTNFFNILEQYNYKVESGDILGGIIIGLERQYLLVDIGFPRISFLVKNETNISQKVNPLLKHYDKIEVLIIFFIKNKLFFVSMKEIHYLALWKRIVEMNVMNTIIYGKLEKSNKKGKLINFEELKLFLPNYYLSKYYKKQKINSKLLPLKFLSMSFNKKLILMNARFATLETQSYLMYLGMKKIGYITKILKFGLFINIHGIKSLLHISELSNTKIEILKNLYTKGKKFQIQVIYYNIQEGKIVLSNLN